MYSGLNSLFRMLGMKRQDDLSGGPGFPDPTETRTEDELRRLAASFLTALENRTAVQVKYHPYQPPVDDNHGNDRIPIPAHIDIIFKDPRGMTHVLEFSGHDRLTHHTRYKHETDMMDKTMQFGHNSRSHTLREALDYLDEMHPNWQIKHRVLVP